MENARHLRVGRRGVFFFPAGYYLYVGSARGGLRQRIERHLREEKKLRWHIDYLLPHAQLREVWWTTQEERLECLWSSLLSRLPETHCPVPGFGSSDCRCFSHLFRFPLTLSPQHIAGELEKQESRGKRIPLQRVRIESGLRLHRL